MKHQAMKTYGEWRYISTICDLGIDGSEWLASRPSHFTTEERAPGAHWMKSLVGSRAGLELSSRE
jgi:hypothetical protein